MDKKLFLLLVIMLTLFPYTKTLKAQQQEVAASLRYTLCSAPSDSNACFIAFNKMRTIINPINGKTFFDDGIHFLEGGQLFMYPVYAVAQPDLDGDGFKELIAVPHEQEETVGTFCPAADKCPHFILQDRNIPGERASLRNFKVLGTVYATAVGLSTDEVVSGYRSLRAYEDNTITTFDVYQYDRKNDEYFNISDR